MTAASTQADFEKLERRVAHGERRAFLRTLVAMAIPVAAAAVILALTYGEIEDAQAKLQTVEGALAEAKTAEAKAKRETRALEDKAKAAVDEAKSAEQRLAELETRLQDAAKFDRHLYPLGWGGVKSAATLVRDGGHVLMLLLEMRSAGFGWSFANTPDKGFTSPGFAAFVLAELGKLPKDSALAEFRQLPVTRDRPKPGDIVLYEGGYAMFYFEDRQGQAFVVGMTPVGITSLQADFGPKRTGVIRGVLR